MKISDIHIMLNQVRKERGLSQSEIAEHLCVEQATISLCENAKRGIPAELLDKWLELLDIEVKFTQKECQPVKGERETENDLEVFRNLKKRRNFLIAELRSFMAIQIAQTPEFQEVDEASGEGAFWSFSFFGDPDIGVVETRYDHPKQKYLAVEYTGTEVNVYSANRFDASNEEIKIKEVFPRLNFGYSYCTEDDFLTLGTRWERDALSRRRITVLKRAGHGARETEIVSTEGFSLRSLLNMQENFEKLEQVVRQVKELPEYMEMEVELSSVNAQLQELILDNRLSNGLINPQFSLWDELDRDAIDIPLWSSKRNWNWIAEGVEWCEDTEDGAIGILVRKEEFNERERLDCSDIVCLTGEPEERVSSVDE